MAHEYLYLYKLTGTNFHYSATGTQRSLGGLGLGHVKGRWSDTANFLFETLVRVYALNFNNDLIIFLGQKNFFHEKWILFYNDYTTCKFVVYLNSCLMSFVSYGF